MDKFTLLELHVHDGMRLSAKNTAPAIGRSRDDDEYDEHEEYDDDVEYEADDVEYEASTSGGKAKFFLGLVLVVGLALAARKLMGGDDDYEIAELDDLGDDHDHDEQEAEA